MSDLVERWRAQNANPHVVIRESRTLGDEMAAEIERLTADLQAANNAVADQFTVITKLEDRLSSALLRAQSSP